MTGAGWAGPWWALLLQGLVSLLSAAIAILWPGITELALFYLIAGWCIATSVFEIAAALQLRWEMQGKGIMALSGVLSIGLGLSIGLFPLVGLLGAGSHARPGPFCVPRSAWTMTPRGMTLFQELRNDLRT